MTIGDSRLIFGGGGEPEGAIALRVSSAATARFEHVSITWDTEGHIETLVVGNELGSRRTGAVSALAADLLAAPGPLHVGLLGSGRNGWTQIWALTGVREVAGLSVYSPNPEHRERLAARARDELGIDARAVSGAREATEDNDLVILCTTSQTPVIDADWVRPGAHVTSIGAKSTRAHETPEALLGRLREVVSDAPDQLNSPISELARLPLVALGGLLKEGNRGHDPDANSLFLYAGLGAADAAYALALSRHLAKSG
jgi:ornithine cyclodeaminase